MVSMNCAELCFQFYILYFTPSRNREPQSFGTSPQPFILNYPLKMVSMNMLVLFWTVLPILHFVFHLLPIYWKGYVLPKINTKHCIKYIGLTYQLLMCIIFAKILAFYS